MYAAIDRSIQRPTVVCKGNVATNKGLALCFWLLACCPGCAAAKQMLAPVDERPLTRVILANDLPGKAQLCIQLPDNALLDSMNVDGPRLACWGTLGDLRLAVLDQHRANQ